MNEAGVRTISAAFRSVGIEARAMPPSDEETLLLGGRLSSGEGRLPQKGTPGGTPKILLPGKGAPEKKALFFPAPHGPPRGAEKLVGVISPPAVSVRAGEGGQ